MPKVIITFDKDYSFFGVSELKGTDEYIDPEYQVVMDMKASHYRNIRRNWSRYNNDQKALLNFFIQAQQTGRVLREQ